MAFALGLRPRAQAIKPIRPELEGVWYDYFKMLRVMFGGLTTKTAHFLSLTEEVLRNHCFLLL